jgi:hypothetical protein
MFVPGTFLRFPIYAPWFIWSADGASADVLRESQGDLHLRNFRESLGTVMSPGYVDM